ncbi:MAG: hypothetical protein K940chlam9_01802 [Chlamydiae bacterium]|nr:hypothetical protein [Chlamydiota bacterium]
MAIASPSDDKASIIEGCYAWVPLVACRVGVDLELYPTFHSAAIIPLPVDAIGTSILVRASPSDDKATIIEGCYTWVQLAACRVGVDLELYPTFHSAASIPLPVDASEIPILAGAFPSDYKAPIIEGCYAWGALVVCRVGVDLELNPTFHSAAIIPLPVDAQGISILAIASPSDDKASIIEGCYAWVPLVTCRVGVDLELYPAFHSAAIIPLPVDAIATPILARALPSDDKAPIIEGCCAWRVLVACRVGVDLELYPTFHSAAIIPLPVDAIEISILTRALPSDDKAPIIEGCRTWIQLLACRVGVDLELYPTFHSAAVIPLPVDAIEIPILAIAIPSDDKATIIEGCYAWVPLLACRIGVDLEL